MTLTQIKPAGLSKPIDLGDNEKLQLGGSQDLQIFHDGTNSVFRSYSHQSWVETNVGLNIASQAAAEYMAKFIKDGAVELYYDNSKKLETTATGATLTGTLLATGSIDIPDSGKLLLGDGDDVQIYHNGTDSVMDVYTSGSLKITNSGSELMAEFKRNNAVELYYDGTKRLSTHTLGAIVDGPAFFIRGGTGENVTLQFIANNSASYNDHYNLTVAATGAFALQTEVSANNFENLLTAAQNGAIELYYDNSKKFETASHGVSIAGNLDFPDNTSGNASLRFGNSQDFFMNHNGSDSYIINNTGDLYIRDLNGDVHIQGKDNEESIIAKADGAVELYHNNVKKLETESNGATVTGRFRVQDSGNVDLAITDTSANAVAAYIGVKTAGHVEYNCYKSGVGTKYPHVFYGYTEEYARIDTNGIKFNGDTAAANALNDYEEGTFTPVMKFGGGNTGMSIGNVEAIYTKIGRVVYATIRFTMTGKGSDTGQLTFTGLPFTVGDVLSSTSVQGGFPLQYLQGAVNAHEIMAYPWEGTSLMKVFKRSNQNSTTSDFTDSDITATFDGRISFFYTT